jgi:hypothetical protein
MHFNVEQILWALILAGHLLLLIVLLGRDRISRFAWFTASIALSTVSLLANHLLHGKLTTIAFYWQSYTALGLDAILGIFVLVEFARRVFGREKIAVLSTATAPAPKSVLVLKGRGWLGGILVTCAIAIAAVWAWGPWPTMQALKAEPAQLPLLIDVLIGMKAHLFMTILTVEVCLLLLIFGRRFGFGWRTHPQQIALGLSTNAIAFLIVQGITDIIKHTVHLTSREQYNRILHLLTNLENGRTALWFIVLIWWIIWLWRDDPTAPATQPILDASATPAAPLQPVAELPHPLEDSEASSS